MFSEITVPEGSESDAYHRTVTEAVAAEGLGFTSFWTVEHHFLSGFSHCSAPEVLYAYVAAKTETMRLGHAVKLLPFPYNHPVRVAEQAAVLDLLSGGRLEVGTGRSATRTELEGFGIDPHQTRELYDEALQVLVRAWADEPLEWKGKHFDIPAATSSRSRTSARTRRCGRRAPASRATTAPVRRASGCCRSRSRTRSRTSPSASRCTGRA